MSAMDQAKNDVAARKGLPAQLADRLRGDSFAALEADADALLAILHPSEPDVSTMTPEEVRAHAGKVLGGFRVFKL